jgi:hypothetical protein
MHIDRHRLARGGFGVGLQGLADHRAKREVGHIVVVHHVKVDPIGTRSDDGLHFFA